MVRSRRDCLQKIKWNQVRRNGKSDDTIRGFECWKSPGTTVAKEGSSYRFTNLRRQQGASVEEVLGRWLKWQDPFPAPVAHGAGPVSHGGMRLVLCERPTRTPGMTLSLDAYRLIEEAFSLHPTTLPSFCLSAGTQNLWVDSVSAAAAAATTAGTGASRRIRIVVKAPQKVEVANWTLSLCHDVATGWTNALICGRGFTVDESSDRILGTQLAQLIREILERPNSWDNVFLLPFCLLQNYVERLETRGDEFDEDLLDLESQIGVTFTSAVGDKMERFRQAQDVSYRPTTIDLHTTSTQIIYILACCQWLPNFASFLARSVQRVQDEALLQPRGVDLRDFVQDVEFQRQTAGNLQIRFQTFRDRAALQTNVLFNLIGQKANDISQRDTQIGLMMTKSSKQDSISMSTFTFLTALYLPSTFIATMFSMGMFDWQGAGDTDAPSSTRPHVTSSFWIFWVVAFPLTVVTMASWYWWSWYANSQWLKQIDNSVSVGGLGANALQDLQQELARLQKIRIRENDTSTLHALRV